MGILAEKFIYWHSIRWYNYAHNMPLQKIKSIIFWLCVVLIFLDLILIRVYFILRTDFPLNDGGMFLPIILDILKNNFVPPPFLTYNHINIPFVYPPLAFYFAALIVKLTKINPIEVLRFLPVSISVITIFVYYHFSYILSKSRFTAIIAVIIFGLLPRSFEWMIMGAGLTRSFGQLFTVLALYFCFKYCQQQTKNSFVYLTVFIGLTILSHPEWVVFEVFSIILFLIYFYNKKKKIISLLFNIFIAVSLFTLPWWSLILFRNQARSFIESFFTGRVEGINLPDMLPFHFIIAMLILILIIYEIFKSLIRFDKLGLFLFVWFLAIFVMQLRSMNTHLSIPFALIMGLSMNNIKSSVVVFTNKQLPIRNIHIFDNLISLFILISISAYMTLLLIVFSPKTISSVNLADRAAMKWIKKNTSRESTYIVMTPENRWWLDKVNEWFPALTDRRSILTVQGYEWLRFGKFQNQVTLNMQFKDCKGRDLHCINILIKKSNIKYSHIYITGIDKNNNFIKLLISLNQSHNFSNIYQDKSVSIWKVNN